MNTDDQRRLVESFVVDGLHPTDEMQAAAERLGLRYLVLLTTSAMTEMVSRRYGKNSPGPADLRQYAQRLSEQYGKRTEAVKPLVVEALIRSHFGETEMLKGLTIDDIIPHQILITSDIFNSLNLDESGLDEFVGKVLKLADESPARGSAS